MLVQALAHIIQRMRVFPLPRQRPVGLLCQRLFMLSGRIVAITEGVRLMAAQIRYGADFRTYHRLPVRRSQDSRTRVNATLDRKSTRPSSSHVKISYA